MVVGPLVEGEPAVLGDPSPSPSEALKSVAGADAASEPVVVIDAVAAEAIAKMAVISALGAACSGSTLLAPDPLALFPELPFLVRPAMP